MKRKFVCIVCPNSCHVEVEYHGREIQKLHGVECQKGRDFIQNEIRHPLRVLTGSVKVRNGAFALVSVKTPTPIPKKFLRQLGSLTHQLQVEAPVEIGQVIAENLLDEGIQLVATRRVERLSDVS